MVNDVFVIKYKCVLSWWLDEIRIVNVFRIVLIMLNKFMWGVKCV